MKISKNKQLVVIAVSGCTAIETKRFFKSLHNVK